MYGARVQDMFRDVAAATANESLSPDYIILARTARQLSTHHQAVNKAAKERAVAQEIDDYVARLGYLNSSHLLHH